jgi:hypothetical protein
LFAQPVKTGFGMAAFWLALAPSIFVMAPYSYNLCGQFFTTSCPHFQLKRNQISRSVSLSSNQIGAARSNRGIIDL